MNKFIEIKNDLPIINPINTKINDGYFSNFSGVAPYDIALLKLSTPLSMNNNVKRINLPKPEEKTNGNCTLSGWGSISTSSIAKMPDILQKAILPVVDLNKCKNALEDIIGPSPLHSTNICTGPLTGGYSACSVRISFD